MGKEQEVMLGVCGGVGPAAGLLLHQAILQNTENAGCDRGHLSVSHFSRSGHISDRTQYLFRGPEDEHLENPACGMAQTLEMMMKGITDSKIRLVAGVPCNTFHSSAIWDEFIRLTKVNQRHDVKIIHMLEETVRFIAQVAPHCQRVGLMSTTGTRKSRVYHDLLEQLGFEVVEVSSPDQTELHDTIYNENWGIKCTAPLIQAKCVANFHRFARVLKKKGADVIIMGCTEIPFAFPGKEKVFGVPLIDPMVALARAMIREADPSRLRALKRDTSLTLNDSCAIAFDPHHDNQ